MLNSFTKEKLPTIRELTKEALDQNLYFVHKTPILPKDGILIPGAILNKNAEDMYLQIKKERKLLPNIRITLHWFVQGIVEEHESSAHKGEYAIIERARNIQTLYGGYIEDMYSVGSHILSNESIVLVPEEKISTAKNILGDKFQGKLIAYKDISLKEAVKQQLCRISKWQIDVEPNQKTEYTVSVQQAAKLLDNPLIEPWLMKQIASKLRLAFFRGDKVVKLFDNTPPQNIKLTLQIGENTKEYKNNNFFYSWYKSGISSKIHSETLFAELENLMKQFFSPLLVLFDTKNLKDLFFALEWSPEYVSNLINKYKSKYEEKSKKFELPVHNFMFCKEQFWDKKFPKNNIKAEKHFVEKTRQVIKDLQVLVMAKVKSNFSEIEEFFKQINNWVFLMRIDLKARSNNKNGIYTDDIALMQLNINKFLHKIESEKNSDQTKKDTEKPKTKESNSQLKIDVEEKNKRKSNFIF